MTRSSGRTFPADGLVPGEARAECLVLGQPLSFWGGLDPATGRITDRHHPQEGLTVSGKILVMPSGRGSSSSSSVLAEAIRAGTGPAGIILHEPDPIIALGALVAAELYGQKVPVVVADAGRILGRRGAIGIVAREDGATVSVL